MRASDEPERFHATNKRRDSAGRGAGHVDDDELDDDLDDDESRTLLVVEDDADLREVVTSLFRDESFDVVEAANGKEALAKLREGLRPGVIFLDLMMPEMSGEELCEILRADDELASIPLVVWSGGKGASTVARAVGAVACLSKPTEWDLIRGIAERFTRNS
jgi:CheY-like chemotaxis protein